MSPQIVLEGKIDPGHLERIERILLLQLGAVASRFTSLKAVVSEGSSEAPLAFQCKLSASLKSGGQLDVTMVNSGLHVCVADAGARLVREVRRSSKDSFAVKQTPARTPGVQ